MGWDLRRPFAGSGRRYSRTSCSYVVLVRRARNRSPFASVAPMVSEHGGRKIPEEQPASLL